jgi:hypothetical protein
MGVVRPDTRRPPSEGGNAISFACLRFDGGSAQRLVQHGLSSVVERLAKAVYIRLRGSVIRHTRDAVFRTHCPGEDQAAPPPLGEFRAEMVGDVQMCHRTDPQGRLMQLPIKL